MAKKRLNMTTLPPVAYIPTPDGIPSHRPLVAGEKIGGEYIQISEQEGNQVQLGNDGGIFVPTSGGGGTTTSLVTANSVSINLSGTGVDGDPLEAELQTGAWTNGNPLTNLVVGVGGAKTNGVFVAGVRRYMTNALTLSS